MTRASWVATAAILLLAACSTGENIIQPPPAPDQPTTAPQLTSTVPAATTTTDLEPTTTEAPPTTRVPATTTLRVQTTIGEVNYSLPYNGWAIPEYIVSCETGGTFDWYAHNKSSDASGPYQLMPLHFGGELAMHQPREVQHAKAAQLWNGGRGKSHWADCL